MRDIVTLGCKECKDRNYTTTRKKAPGVSRLEIRKFCRRCGKHTAHKEVR